LDQKSKRKIRQVECICGYTYTKSFIKHKDQIFIRVKHHGALWVKECKRLLKAGNSIRKVASILNSDSKTINAITNPKPKKKSNKELKLNLLKEEWLILIKKNQGKTITCLRKLKSALYTKLYRYDKNWLKNQKYHKNTVAIKTSVKNWNTEDADLYRSLRLIYNKIKERDPKRRITKSLLYNHLSASSIWNNEDKLPRSICFVNSVLESKEDHRIRRLKMAQKYFLENEIEISKWKLLRQAGIRKEYLNIKVLNAVTDILREGTNIDDILIKAIG
jgi:hypothetical protein